MLHCLRGLIDSYPNSELPVPSECSPHREPPLLLTWSLQIWEWKKECLPAVSGEPASVVLKPACAPVNWLCSLAVPTSTLRFQSSFPWSFSPKFICTFTFQRLFHACLQGCSMAQQGFFIPHELPHRVHGHLLVVLSLSLCVPSDPVFYVTKALPTTDDITFWLHFKCPPQLPLLLSLPSSVLDLNIVYPLRCTTCPLLPAPPFPSLLTCVLSHLKPSPCFYPSSSPFPHLMLGDSSQQVPRLWMSTMLGWNSLRDLS